MKRYNHEYFGPGDDVGGNMNEAEDGDWVRYEDHAADRAALVAQLEELTRERDAARELWEAATNERDEAHKALELAQDENALPWNEYRGREQ